MVWEYACGLDIIVKVFLLLFFHIVNLVFFHSQYTDSGYLVSTTPHTILYQSFLNFAHDFFHSLKLCMCFWYNPCIIFCHLFSTLWTLSFSDISCIDRGSLRLKLLIQCYTVLLKLFTCFLQGLQKCMWFRYNFWIYFCRFFHFIFVIFLPQILLKCIDFE